MALSVMITVGDAASWVPELVERAKSLKVGNGLDEKTEMYVRSSASEMKMRVDLLTQGCREWAFILQWSCHLTTS